VIAEVSKPPAMWLLSLTSSISLRARCITSHAGVGAPEHQHIPVVEELGEAPK
jgi:hypothetical protein